MWATRQTAVSWSAIILACPVKLLVSTTPTLNFSSSTGKMVRYKSTRGEVHGLSFKEAVLTGLASDRGLLIPEKDDFPSLPSGVLALRMHLSYREFAFKVMRLFIDPEKMSNMHLRDTIDQSYRTPIFESQKPTRQTDNISIVCVGALPRANFCI